MGVNIVDPFLVYSKSKIYLAGNLFSEKSEIQTSWKLLVAKFLKRLVQPSIAYLGVIKRLD